MAAATRYSFVALVSTVVAGLLSVFAPPALAATSTDIVSTIAGNGTWGTPTEGAGTASPLAYVGDVAMAPDGTPFGGSTFLIVNSEVWRLTPAGEFSRFAGGGEGFTEGEPAREAQLGGSPIAIDVAPDGQLYFGTSGGIMYRVDTQQAIHQQPADALAQTFISYARGMDVDSQGRAYLAVEANTYYVVERLESDGSVTNIAGIRGNSLGCGPVYDKPVGEPDRQVINMKLTGPRDVVLSADERTVYVADSLTHVILSVPIGNPGGYSTTQGSCFDNTSSAWQVNSLALHDGTLYWTSRHRIFSEAGLLGGSTTGGYSGDGGPASAALFNFPSSIDVGGNGALVATDSSNYRLRQIAPPAPEPETHTLTVSHAGDAWGAITGTGIACGVGEQMDCTEDFDEGSTLTLTAEPAGGSQFTGWTGCNSIDEAQRCVVTMTSDREVVATFEPTPKHTLTVQRAGTGSGTVTGTGIDCGATCSHSYESGTQVTLTAAPAPGSRFGTWTGCDDVVDGACKVTMDHAKQVTASFVARHVLTVTRSGTASGTVTGTGIDCGADCSETYDDGSSVTLTAAPAGGSMFSGWTGCNSIDESNRCIVTMTSAREVVASFEPTPKHTLTVTRTGTGTGKVTGTGIDCGSTCTHSYEPGTLVTLTATPAAGVWFDGWTGCSDIVAGDCVVAMTESRAVTATFTDIPEHQLSVTVTGAGAGSVLGQGINCGADCTQSFLEDTEVTLVATPDATSTFEGWTGCDTVEEGDCVVTMDAARTVTAAFEPAVVETRSLTVERSGKGSGSVTGPQISCGADCSGDFEIGTEVVLTAVPAQGSTFKGWANCDSSTGNECVVTVGTDRIVGAKFAPAGASVKTEITSSKIVNKRRKATFEFTGSSAAGSVTFQCRLDAKKWQKCRSPRTYTKLRPGSHTFKVRAVDSTGVTDPTPASVKFVIRR